MSYTHQDAQIEQDELIRTALDTRDSEQLRQMAEMLKEQGEDEEADRLLKTARRFETEDWAYDESINN